MLYTLAHGRTFCSKFVEGGACSDTDVVDDRINEAVQHLLTAADPKLTLRRYGICTHTNCITMPREVEVIRAFTIDHRPGVPWSKFYEMLEGGPGRIDQYTCNPQKDLVDLGAWYPTFKDIPANKYLKVMALCTEEDDEDLEMTIMGRGLLQNEVFTSGVPGQTLKISRWTEGVEGNLGPMAGWVMSEFEYSSISSIVKPVTKGYVSLFAYDPEWATDTDEPPMLYFLGKYHPDETNPGYRRYRILNHALYNPASECCTGDYVIALCKLGYVAAKHPNDVLLIQSLPALKAMIQALNQYDAKEIAAGQAYESQALSILAKQINDSEHQSNEVTVESSFGLGQVEAVR